MCPSVNINRTSTLLTSVHISIFPDMDFKQFHIQYKSVVHKWIRKSADTTFASCRSPPIMGDPCPHFVCGVPSFVRRKDLKSKGAKTTKDFAYDQGQLLLHKGHHNFKAFFSFSRAFFYFKSQTLLSLFFEEKLDVINIKYQWPLTFCSRVVLSVFSADNN